MSNSWGEYKVSANNLSIAGDIEIPERYDWIPVTEIASSGFANCTLLNSIAIPQTITYIWQNAFLNCSSLTKVTFAESPVSVGIGSLSLGNYAFKNCSSLKSINLPSYLTRINLETFRGCESLTDIVLLASLTQINDNAFYGCISLTSIDIPNLVTNIRYLKNDARQQQTHNQRFVCDDRRASDRKN